MGFPVAGQLDLRSVTASTILKTFLDSEGHRKTNKGLKKGKRESKREEK